MKKQKTLTKENFKKNRRFVIVILVIILLNIILILLPEIITSFAFADLENCFDCLHTSESVLVLNLLVLIASIIAIAILTFKKSNKFKRIIGISAMVLLILVCPVYRESWSGGFEGYSDSYDYSLLFVYDHEWGGNLKMAIRFFDPHP